MPSRGRLEETGLRCSRTRVDGLAGGGARARGHRGRHGRLHLPHARRRGRRRVRRRSLRRPARRPGDRRRPRRRRPARDRAPVAEAALPGQHAAAAHGRRRPRRPLGRRPRPRQPGRGPGQARGRDVVGAHPRRRHRARRGGRRRLDRRRHRHRQPRPRRRRADAPATQPTPRPTTVDRTPAPAASSGARPNREKVEKVRGPGTHHPDAHRRRGDRRGAAHRAHRAAADGADRRAARRLQQDPDGGHPLPRAVRRQGPRQHRPA